MGNNIILYTTPDGHVNVQVQFEDGSDVRNVSSFVNYL